jgi:pimeloyl-ACP methyl ester carboxylesterase
MGKVALAGVELDLWEGGDGPPLLFLHGAGGFRADDEFVGLLARGRRMAAPSHPGFGGSSLPDWIDRPGDIALVYLDLLDRFGHSQIDLIGCSLGGWIGADLASMVPERVRRLVLSGPVGIKVGSRDRLDIPDIFAIPAAAVDRLIYCDPERHRRDPDRLSDDELATVLRNRETLALLVWEPYMHDPKLRHRLHRVRCPTLLVRGESDGLVSAAYLESYAGLLPNAQVATIAGSAHAPQLEQPQAFAELALSFLDG